MTATTQNKLKLLFWALFGLNVIIIVVSVFTIIIPRMRMMRVLRQDREAVAVERARVEETLQKFEHSFSEVEQYEQLSARLRRILPVHQNQSAVYDEVTALVSRAGLALAGIDVQPIERKSAGIVNTQVVVRVEGVEYRTLRGFLSLLEQAPHLFEVRSVVFNPQITQTSFTLWTYAFASSVEP